MELTHTALHPAAGRPVELRTVQSSARMDQQLSLKGDQTRGQTSII